MIDDQTQLVRPSLTRRDASVRVHLTEREARALARATALVVDVLRPELLGGVDSGSESPLVTAHQVLVAASERAGVDLRTIACPCSERSSD